MIDGRARESGGHNVPGPVHYLPEAISPSCGGMTLQIFSEKDPNTPVSKILDAETIQRVWNDFDPYRKAQASKTP